MKKKRGVKKIRKREREKLRGQKRTEYKKRIRKREMMARMKTAVD